MISCVLVADIHHIQSIMDAVTMITCLLNHYNVISCTNPQWHSSEDVLTNRFVIL